MEDLSLNLESNNVVESELNKAPIKTSFNYNKLAIFMLIILIMVTIFGIFIVGQKTRTNKITQDKNAVLSNILYPPTPDPSGRNIYYSLNDIQAKNLRYSGVGIIYLSNNFILKNKNGQNILDTSSATPKLIDYIVGSFVRWDKIPGSKDRYMILKDDLQSRDANTNNPINFPKIRVGFSMSNTNFVKNNYQTNIGVEDLGSVIPKTIDARGGVKTFNLKSIGSFSDKILNEIIKPNDTIAVTFSILSTTKKNLVDSSNIPVAAWIFIRRFNPAQELSKEEGK